MPFDSKSITPGRPIRDTGVDPACAEPVLELLGLVSVHGDGDDRALLRTTIEYAHLRQRTELLAKIGRQIVAPRERGITHRQRVPRGLAQPKHQRVGVLPVLEPPSPVRQLELVRGRPSPHHACRRAADTPHSPARDRTRRETQCRAAREETSAPSPPGSHTAPRGHRRGAARPPGTHRSRTGCRRLRTPLPPRPHPAPDPELVGTHVSTTRRQRGLRDQFLHAIGIHAALGQIGRALDHETRRAAPARGT